MRILDLPEIRLRIDLRSTIDRMRDALVSHSEGECDTPMPMHLDIAQASAEVHIKASYRRGGRHFALKVAGSFPRNPEHGFSTSSGMMMLCSAETGAPVALLQDEGYLTDLRTAAVAAATARELGCGDRVLGILGAGVQARLQARLLAEVLALDTVWLWSRSADHAAACAREVESMLPGVRAHTAETPARVAVEAALIVTVTPSRAPLLMKNDIRPGTRILAVGSDGPGKQELDPAILRSSALILADSLRQCQKLGELQHAPGDWGRTIEIGQFCRRPVAAGGTVVCDFTGLGVEDLFIAELIWERGEK